MIHIPKKWKITVHRSQIGHVTFYYHDDHVENILREIAKVSFDPPADKIEIEYVKRENPQTGYSHE